AAPPAFASVASSACTAPVDTGACPYVAGPAVLFDRCFGSIHAPGTPGNPTGLGNTGCNGARDAKKLLDTLGRDASKVKRDAEKDVNDFMRLVANDAINKDAIKRFNEAAAFPKQLQKDIDGLLQDRDCGTKAAMDELKRNFTNIGNGLGTLGLATAKTTEAVGKLGPALGEIQQATAETAVLLQEVANAPADVKQKVDALGKALADVKRELEKVQALDVAGLAAAVGTVAGTTGPFMASASACAAGLSTAITSLSAGGGAAAGGAASCPESVEAFGGGCWGVVAGVPVATIGPALSTALSSAACTAATGEGAAIGTAASAIIGFFDKVSNVVDSLGKSVDALGKAAAALESLPGTLSASAKRHAGSIAAHLDKAGDSVDACSTILSNDVSPKLGQLGSDFVTEMAKDLGQLNKCYNKLQTLVARMGGGAVEAMADFASASLFLVDGGKAFDNIAKQVPGAVSAAGSAANAGWNDVNREYGDTHRALLGVDPGVVNIPVEGAKLAALATNSAELNRLVKAMADLAAKIGQIPGKALTAGKAAFLDVENKKREARQKFDSALAKAQSAKTKFEAAARAPAKQIVLANIAVAKLKLPSTNLKGLKVKRAVIR
ncbi:MAG: hypothetical protein ABIT01_01230, partial [Thermoanaerobaculia bacterium]